MNRCTSFSFFRNLLSMIGLVSLGCLKHTAHFYEKASEKLGSTMEDMTCTYSKSIPRFVHSYLSPLPLPQSRPYFLPHLQLSAFLPAPYTRALTALLPWTHWGDHSPTSKSGDQIPGTGQFILRPFGGMRTWVTEPEGSHAPCCLPWDRSAHTLPHQLFPIKF